MKYIGEKIRSIRTLRGYSQENMADMIGVSLPTYADIERGKKDVTIGRLEQIAEKLGVSLNDVLAFNERVSNFFDNCTNASISDSVNEKAAEDNFDKRELKHEIEKLQLELKLLKAEKEKADLEIKYWKELAEKQ